MPPAGLSVVTTERDDPVGGDLAAWLTACLDADERTAREAIERAPAPWRNDDGLVVHSGPEDYARGRGLWDSEGTRDPHHLCMELEVAEHVALHDPAAVLADIAAKRRLLGLHRDRVRDPLDGLCDTCDPQGAIEMVPCPTLRALASAYAGRDGWREGWR